MTHMSVFTQALALLGEDTSGNYSADYLARAPFLLATVTSELAESDALYRAAHGESGRTAETGGTVDMNDELGLSDIFAPAVVYYLASMLVFDTDEKKSDTLYDKFCDICAKIESRLPFTAEKTAQRYPF